MRAPDGRTVDGTGAGDWTSPGGGRKSTRPSRPEPRTRVILGERTRSGQTPRGRSPAAAAARVDLTTPGPTCIPREIGKAAVMCGFMRNVGYNVPNRTRTNREIDLIRREDPGNPMMVNDLLRDQYECFPYPSMTEDGSGFPELANLMTLFGRDCGYTFERRKVLDAGTGTGLRLLELAKAFPDNEYLGIDYSRKSIECAGPRKGPFPTRESPSRPETSARPIAGGPSI